MTDEYEEVPAEEKIAITQYFLQSSPPGEIDLVYGDVKKLIPSGLIDDSALLGIYRAYNLEEMCTVENEGHRVPICSYGEVDASHYIDTDAKKVLEVDHKKRTVISTSSVKSGMMDKSLEELRSALQAAINTYMGSQFSKELSSCGVYAKDGKIHVVISAESVQLRNFWSGRWRSSYTITPSKGEYTIEGWVKVRCHYFEDGNLQLHQVKEFEKKSVAYSNASTFASSIVEGVTKMETDLQTGLESMYGTMNEETFKEMRRVLPLTKEKFNWNANAHKMISSLRG
jgi:capping protein alpha